MKISRIANLLEDYKGKKREIVKRLSEFEKIKDDELFYELCFCILTPQTNAKQAWQAILKLKAKDFQYKEIDPIPLVYPIRFYKNKSRYLLELKGKFNSIRNEIKQNNDIMKLREFLILNVKGYGYKEASHSLRNIGFRSCAILDRHILKNLQKFDIVEKIPKTLSKKQYLSIEEKFKRFSQRVKIPIDHLDLLFWSQETGEIFK